MLFSMSARGAGRPVDAVDLTTPDASHVSSSVSGFKKGPGTAFNDATVNNDDNNRVLIQKTALDIVYTFDTPTRVDAYGIQNFNKTSYECDKRAPKAWTFSGSNDGNVWTTLDTRTSETGWAFGEYRFYQFGNFNMYLKYKIDITANNGNQYTQFARMELFSIAPLTAVTVRGNPVDLGTVVPDYGVLGVDDPDADITFSLTGEGSCYYSADGGSRGTFASATYKIGDGEAQTVTDTSFTLKPTASIDVTWNFADVSHRLTAEALAGGMVTVGDITGTAITNWYPAGNAVTLTAVPAEGKSFGAWAGDVPTGADRTAATLELTVDQARTVKALFYAGAESEPVVFDTTSYIKENLIAHFDGKENAGVGVHNAEATQWTDLSGHGNDLVNTMDETYVWGWNENGYTNLDYKGDSFTTGKKAAVNTRFKPAIPNVSLDLRNFTFETDINAPGGAGYMFYLPGTGHSASEGLTFRFDGSGAFQVLGAGAGQSLAPSFRSGPFSFAFDYGTNGAYTDRAYVEGVGRSSSTSPTAPVGGNLYEGPAYFLSKNGNSYFGGEMRTARLYDRALSDWEVEWNSYVDMVRYHGVVPDAEHVVHTYCSLPANYGTPETPYGTTTLDDGVTLVYSAAAILTTSADDGARIANQNVGAGCRMKFTGWTLHCGNIVRSGSDEIAFAKLTNCRSQFAWTFVRQVGISAHATAGGAVSVDGGTPGTDVCFWTDPDFDGKKTVALAAVADDDHVFGGWAGDIGSANPKATEIVVTADVARNVTAAFYEKVHTPVTLTWKAGMTAGDFADPTCWTEGAMPQEGDTVVLSDAAATTIRVSLPPPHLAKLVIGNTTANKATTLVLSGWGSCLQADEVVVQPGGVITHAGPYKTEDEASRVWIKANGITVQAGGKITADGVGYAGSDRGNGIEGYGPAWWISHQTVHPSVAPVYSGLYRYGQGYAKGRLVAYGDPVRPDLPGSGGKSAEGHAGGAIKLEVAERLTVDGTISANAAMSGNCSSSGTGGAVWITCKSITGSGTVQANAKNCSLVTALQNGYVGGAGRVAIHYDPVEQAKEEDCTVRFEALASVHYNNVDIYNGTYGCEPGQKVQDQMLGGHYEEGLAIHGRGSLYFTDDTLLKAASYRKAGWRFGGELFTGSPIADLVFDEPMTFDKCQLVVHGNGCRVTANAGLNVFGTGYYARREMGVVFSNATVTVNGPLTIAGSRFGVSDGTLTVNGDVVQTNAVFSTSTPYLGGELVAHAGPTNTPSGYGAEVTVNGNWTLGEGGVVHVTCDPDNGAITKIIANGNLSIAEGARVDSDMGGYRYGPGSAKNYSPGPSHGGRGSGGAWPKATYGSEKEPVTPGSGGGQVGNDGYSYSYGGGVVLLEVANKLTLDGTISADSNRKWGGYYFSPGSGGSVNIRAFRLSGNGTISASGGVSDGYGGTATEGDLKNGLAAGGGGRIAVRVNPYGCSWTDEMKANNAYAKPGPRRASGGYSAVFSDPLVYDAEPGTVWWGKWGLGAMILVR